ncbi:MAG: hypothetical protein WAO98_04430 [Alphaproteobacteria bacterium]
MAVKAVEVFQGNNWLTYRWSVAQVFDTLDRMRELCRHTPATMTLLPQAQGMNLPRFDLLEADYSEIYNCLVDLCDDLSGELDAALADLHHHLQQDITHNWMSFEIRLHVAEMRETAVLEQQAMDPAGSAVDTIVALIERICDLLKQIDQ